jgi:hypothetical protein
MAAKKASHVGCYVLVQLYYIGAQPARTSNEAVREAEEVSKQHTEKNIGY